MRKEDAVIGARVVAVTEVDGMSETLGKEGRIIRTEGTDMYDICVEFDDYIDGLRNGGTGEDGPSGKWGHCWWGYLEDFELITAFEALEIKLSFDDLLGGS